MTIHIIGEFIDSRRRFWCLAVACCFLLSAIHGLSLIWRYQTYPTRVRLLVSNNQSLRIPDTTFCPLDRFDLVKLNQLWKEHFGVNRTHPVDPTLLYYQLADLIHLPVLWRKISYTSADDLISLVTIFGCCLENLI